MFRSCTFVFVSILKFQYYKSKYSFENKEKFLLLKGFHGGTFDLLTIVLLLIFGLKLTVSAKELYFCF